MKGAREELAQFLRSRRERVKPAAVGLKVGARRRTPGLRREEVAQLADVGLSWYTWLEQGRDIQVSEPLLERLARALHMTPAERAHLFELAHGRPAPRPVLAAKEASEALQRVLDAHPYPAVATTIRSDIVAWNRAAAILYGDFGLLPSAERNALRTLFTVPSRRTLMPDWEKTARASVARFRHDAARARDRAPFDALASDLRAASPDFARFWEAHDVAEGIEGQKQLVHPKAGAITFDHLSLTHVEPDGRELRVTFYAPQPGTSTERADALFSRR